MMGGILGGIGGEKAVEDATQAFELTKWSDGDYIDSLAAAHAELGDFDSAIKWQEKAVALANPANKSALQSHLDL